MTTKPTFSSENVTGIVNIEGMFQFSSQAEEWAKKFRENFEKKMESGELLESKGDAGEVGNVTGVEIEVKKDYLRNKMQHGDSKIQFGKLLWKNT